MAAVVVHADVLPSRLDDLFGADGGAHIRPGAMGRRRFAGGLAGTGVTVEGVLDELGCRRDRTEECAKQRDSSLHNGFSFHDGHRERDSLSFVRARFYFTSLGASIWYSTIRVVKTQGLALLPHCWDVQSRIGSSGS